MPMSMDFTFYTAGEIIFGRGKLGLIGEVAARFGRRAMLCTRGQSLREHSYVARIEEALTEKNITCFEFNLPSREPTVSDVDQGAEIAREREPDLIIGLGGGSAIDTAKAISGLATNPGSVADYLEGVGRGWQIEKPSLPYIAVPTTAGTGSEVTKNAVISSDGREFKKSIRSPHLIPDVALLDPELTISVPPQITAETGMDALTQLIESYVSRKAQPIPRALSIYGVRLVGRFLRRAVKDGRDVEAREGMLLASLLSGMALANSGLGAAHGVAAALGALAHVPHGRACAVLLPPVMRLNSSRCTSDFAEIARALEIAGSSEEALAQGLVTFVEQLNADIGIPQRFSQSEVDPSLLPALVKASYGSSMKGNPIPLGDEEIERLIREVLTIG